MFLKQTPPKGDAMGLGRYGFNSHPRAKTMLTPIFHHGKIVHGLTTEADIKMVEAYYGLSLKDPAHAQQWLQKTVMVGHEMQAIDPNNPEDIFKLGLLRAHGELAPTPEEQGKPGKFYRFMIVSPEADEKAKLSINQKQHKAGAVLHQIYTKEPKYCIALAKFLCETATGIVKEEQAYNKLTEFVTGQVDKTLTIAQAIDKFTNTIDPDYGGRTPREKIFVTMDLNEAEKYGIIKFSTTKGHYYNTALGVGQSNYGQTRDEVIDFLLSVSGVEHYGNGDKDDKEWSIKAQLRQKRAY